MGALATRLAHIDRPVRVWPLGSTTDTQLVGQGWHEVSRQVVSDQNDNYLVWKRWHHPASGRRLDRFTMPLDGGLAR